MNREELAKMIKKGGASTIYKVVDLLNDDDPQTRNFVSGVLFDLGKEAVEPLKKYLELQLGKSQRLTTSLFYVIDIISDHGDRSILPLLNKMLNRCSTEEQQLFVYEALAKLGEWDIVLPVVEELVKDDNLKDFRDLIIMIFGYIYTSRSFNNLSKLYDSPDFQYTKDLILDAARKIILNADNLNEVDKDSRLLKDIKNEN